MTDASQRQSQNYSQKQSQKQSKKQTQNQVHKPAAKPARTGLEIAVIGMAGRFPEAKNIHDFWENLKNGKESIQFFSHQELMDAGNHPELISQPGYVRAKASLDDVQYFDAAFFNYTPNEAALMDPQLRLFHQCAWHALEDAGYAPRSHKGLIGLYAGYTPNMLWQARQLLHSSSSSQFLEAGNLNSPFFATLICYKLNLKGPGISLNTACSTSLVAVHMACRALLTGECDIVLAGGVAVTLPVKTGYRYEEGMIMSPDGHCRPFDAAANGTAQGNGAGVVVLKRLVKALKDNDHIYAIIKGTAINNDGSRKPGYTAPSVEAQTEVIRAARRIAGVEASSIAYIETHGTGTPMGDPIEFEALRRSADPEQQPRSCRLGFVKANVGHLDAAAGITGFIKTVMTLYHRQIAPAVNFQSANPELKMEESPFYIEKELTGWHANESPRRAGVNSFGIGGTNAHVILEEPPLKEFQGGEHGEYEEKEENKRERLLVLSARSQPALDNAAKNLAEYLAESLEGNSNTPALDDVAYTLQIGRQGFEYRRMLTCRGNREAVDLLSKEPPASMTHYVEEPGNKRIVFLFPGLGDQYVNMGRDLYESEPLFKEQIDRCLDVLRSRVDFDLKSYIFPEQDTADSALIEHFEIAQAAVFVFEYALARLMMHRGVTPHAMTGYSFGEYVAACIAGVFSLEDALTLVALRGKLIMQTEDGAMLSVPVPKDKALELLREFQDNYPEGDPKRDLSIAIDNGDSCVVAGTVGRVDEFEKRMKENRYICIRLQASRAIHTPMMSPIAGQFEEQVSRLTLKPPLIPIISNVTGNWLSPEDAVNPRYWAAHLQQAVRFSDGLDTLLKEGDAVFVETGPGSALSSLALQRPARTSGHAAVNLAAPPNHPSSGGDYLLKKTGKLWLHGIDIDWKTLYQDKQRRRVPLPGYPFDRLVYPTDLPLAELIAGTSPGAEAGKPAAPQSSSRPLAKKSYVAPRNKAEQLLADMWQELLGISPIGIHDNLLDMGVNSVNGITFVNRLKEQLGEIIHITAIFDAPTIAELADYFKTHYPQRFAALTGETLRTEQTEEEKVTTEKIMRFRRFSSFGLSPAEPEEPLNPPAVFILSPPRTGSTLLRVMLAGHPGLFAPPELNLLYYDTLGRRRAELEGAGASHLQGVLHAIMQIKNCSIGEARAIMAGMEEKDTGVKEFYRLLQQWLGERLLVDKSPGYANDPEVLNRAECYFDNALYIHLSRHPYGMIRSYVEAKMDLLGGQQLSKMLSLTRRQLAEITWTNSEYNIKQFLEQVPQNRQFHISFEDLVNRPESAVHEICGFLNLDFHPGMLKPYQEKQQRMTGGVHAEGHMIGDPKFHQHKSIDTSVADTWRQHYKEDFLGEPTLEIAAGLGYKPIHEGKIGPEKMSAAVSENLWKLDTRTGADNDLFFIHEVSGEVGIYLEFCRHLDVPFNCWGIQASRLKDFTPTHLSTGDLAARYIEKIKKIRPRGPYYLLTWSSGGNIAFEMALQLEQQGEAPALLIFVDCGGPMGRLDNPYHEFTLESEFQYIESNFPGAGIRNALKHITRYEDLWPALVEYLKSSQTLTGQLKEQVKQDPILAMLHFEGMRVEDAIQYLNITRTLTNASVHYIPSAKIRTPIHFFSGNQSERKAPEYWNEYCQTPITYYQVEGGHYSVFQSPNVKKLVEKVRPLFTMDHFKSST